ncbi:MAG: DUF1800 family protein [Herpetosiphonaceae bacterium]|nr:DUF1800 family protein [Herpetosiphonaceae bacterium]
MPLSRRTFLKGSAALFAAVGLPSWAVAELHAHGEPTVLAKQLFSSIGLDANDPVVHVLNRTSFGPTTAEVARVRQMGTDAYIEEQLHPEAIDDSAVEQQLISFTTISMSGADLLSQGQQGAKQVDSELRQATMLRALNSRRQLQEVLVDFWSNHFNVYIGKEQCRFLKPLDDRETIRPHTLGRFRDLLGASAKSPAMLTFLDNRHNRKQAPNENYARELMELHTLSVDGGYTEADVEAVARCFTGWTVQDGAFRFAPNQHDRTAKTVLGITIPAGGGIEDGERVLDLLAQHPRTAQFITTKVCRRFVADEPPQSLIDRVAGVFQSTAGDLRQVTAAILHSPEFTASTGQKFRRPFEYVAATARALGVQTAGEPLIQQCALLDQAIFGAQSPAGYPDVAAAWMNTAGLVGRWRYALALAGGKLKDTPVDLQPLVQAATTPQDRAQQLVAALLPGYSETQLPTELAKLFTAPKLSPQQLTQRTAVAAGLLMAAPIFQWR